MCSNGRGRAIIQSELLILMLETQKLEIPRRPLLSPVGICMPHVCSSNQLSRELQLCLQEAGEVSYLHSSQTLFYFSHKLPMLISTRGATPVYSGHCTYSHMVLKTCIFCSIYRPLEGLMDIVCLLSRKRHTPILCTILESQYSKLCRIQAKCP